MDIVSDERYEVYTRYVDNKISGYDFIAEDGFCFYRKSEILKDEDENDYYEHFTAFSLLIEDVSSLEDYGCVPYEDGMAIH